MSIIVLTAACSSGPPCPAGQCLCTASGCACPNGTACGGFDTRMGCSAEGDACNLTCTSGDPCTGGCRNACNITCERSSCTLVAADAASVRCAEGASCDVTCTGNACSVTCAGRSECALDCRGTACSMSCEAEALCLMRCPGEGGYRDVEGSRGC
ncbi:MAG: hypothetical protein IT378_01095 [Sandaracinaceae bacterium]|nr:hypothetical protein [Sandaracinaceae bacterium]